MDDINDTKNKIDEHYSTVDKNTLNTLCTNTNIKNIIYLSSLMDINPFNKRNKKIKLKPKDKLLKECEQIKKKELKDLSLTLSNLAKLGNNTEKVKNTYKKFESKIDNLDKIITYVNQIDIPNDNHDTGLSNVVSFGSLSRLSSTHTIKKYSDSTEDFLECFGNC